MWRLSEPSQIILGDETLTVVRVRRDEVASVVYVDGRAVQRLPMQFDVRCNVQPMSGKDLAILPEGQRLTDTVWIWAWPAPEASMDIGDKVTIDGDWYQVQSAEDWGSYSRCMAVRIDVGPDTAADFELRPGRG